MDLVDGGEAREGSHLMMVGYYCKEEGQSERDREMNFQQRMAF